MGAGHDHGGGGIKHEKPLWWALGLTATGFALVAAFLNAAFGICLGCQIYPLVARLRRVPSPA